AAVQPVARTGPQAIAGINVNGYDAILCEAVGRSIRANLAAGWIDAGHSAGQAGHPLRAIATGSKGFNFVSAQAILFCEYADHGAVSHLYQAAIGADPCHTQRSAADGPYQVVGQAVGRGPVRPFSVTAPAGRAGAP